MKTIKIIIVSFLIFSLITQCISPSEPTIEDLEKLWEIELSELSNSGFLVAENELVFKTQVYINGKLYKVSKDGKKSHSVSIGGCTRGVPVLSNNIIYTNSCGYSLHALNLNDLTIIWEKTNFLGIPIPAVDEEFLYVTDINVVSALNKKSGSLVWSTPIWGKNAWNPVVDGDRILFATGGILNEDGYLYSINKSNGELIYKNKLPFIENNSQFGGSTAMVTIWENFVIVPSDNRFIYCFEKFSGELIWSFEADAPIWATAKVMDGFVYFGTLNRTCYALDVQSGQFKWSYQGGGSIMYDPTFYKNFVLFKASGALLILDRKNGKEIIVLNKSTTGYSFSNAHWDIDGKLYATGFRVADNIPILVAYQF